MVNGTHEGEGRVEVKFRDQWGSVCSSGWSTNDAKVVCRQLGYDVSVMTDIHAVTTLTSGGITWLSNIGCSGSENNLAECSHKPWGASSCRHAGVQCVIAPTTQGRESSSNANNINQNNNVVSFINTTKLETNNG